VSSGGRESIMSLLHRYLRTLAAQAG